MPLAPSIPKGEYRKKSLCIRMRARRPSAGLLISDAFSTVPYCPTSVSHGFLLRHRGRHPLFSPFSELFEASAPLVWRKEGGGGGGGGGGEMCQPRAKRGHAYSLFFFFSTAAAECRIFGLFFERSS